MDGNGWRYHLPPVKAIVMHAKVGAILHTMLYAKVLLGVKTHVGQWVVIPLMET